ncbi:hypothetical protein BDA99DRAFT_547442 [Phascolomyces articulosus]|uniref:Uncharacterized protein n=1 Tax=Phascolomyces articulosus TaxID=60185 RepID=A0AAD5JXJ7_9FUNG|nr:hypothetical protein BDA99DRAFT_547442 [Phascolomyces articulosus]
MLQAIGKSVATLPLEPLAFEPLNIGQVKPNGWLSNQLEIEADGLAGHLYEFFANVKDSPWVGGKSDYSDLIESGPYWANGLIALAYQLENKDLTAQVETFMNYIIDHQLENGWLGPADSTILWPRVLVLHALTQYAEGNPDMTDKVVDVMHKFYAHANDMLNNQTGWESWGRVRWYEMGVPTMWLLEKYPNGQEDVLINVLKNLRDQGDDWRNFFREQQFPKDHTDSYITQLTHGVNNGMAIKAHTVGYRFSHDPADLEWTRQQIDLLYKYHGRPNGLFAADEHFAGLHPSRGTELCTVVDMAYSFMYNYLVMGERLQADYAERVIYNGLPAEMTEDMWAHQYLQQYNQMSAIDQNPYFWTHDGSDSTVFGLEPNYPCCTVNHPQGFPKFVAHMFMTADDAKTIVAGLLGPAKVSARLADNNAVTVTADTMYPFASNLTYVIEAQKDCQFAFRVPGFVKNDVTYSVNGGKITTGAPDGNSIVKIPVAVGTTTIEITIPMEIEVVELQDGSVSIQRGPLTYALPIDYNSKITKTYYEKSVDYAFTNSSRWEYAIDTKSLKFNGEPTSLPDIPFSTTLAPIKISASVCLVEWGLDKNSAAFPPKNPACVGDVQQVDLVPYGSTRMRIAQFPVMSA